VFDSVLVLFVDTHIPLCIWLWWSFLRHCLKDVQKFMQLILMLIAFNNTKDSGSWTVYGIVLDGTATSTVARV